MVLGGGMGLYLDTYISRINILDLPKPLHFTIQADHLILG